MSIGDYDFFFVECQELVGEYFCYFDNKSNPTRMREVIYNSNHDFNG